MSGTTNGDAAVTHTVAQNRGLRLPSPIVEPPLSDELPEMIQRASELDDPTVFRLCDVLIAARKRRHLRTSGNGSPPEAA